MNLTSCTYLAASPKRRNLVLSDFIHACVEENTLLNEEGNVETTCGESVLSSFLHIAFAP